MPIFAKLAAFYAVNLRAGFRSGATVQSSTFGLFLPRPGFVLKGLNVDFGLTLTATLICPILLRRR